MMIDIPADWRDVLAEEISQPWFGDLARFVEDEPLQGEVYPPAEAVFAALALTPYADVRVVLLGQDPYHGVGQAHGLCFSVPAGVRKPPSLVNIFKELHADLGVAIPTIGDLTPWARQGVLLLNAVLTVRAHAANSHQGRGWEKLTDAIIRKVSEKSSRVVFVLWGAFAQKKAGLIDASRHVIIASAHPSPLSARTGFFGSRPFSKINHALEACGRAPIDWRLP